MALYTDIYTYLNSVSAITTLLNGDRIQYPDGDITERNGIIYRMISSPKLESFNRASTRVWALYRFFINNENPVTCKQIADALELYLHTYSGLIGSSQVQYIFQDSNSDPVKLEDLATYQAIQDYRFTII